MKKLRSCTISRGTQICETKSWLARQKSAGILDVFQTFLTQPTAILAAKLCAEAIVYPVTEIAEILDKGRTTIQDTLNELAAAGLMERKRTRFAAANHIYVKVPPVVQVSVPMTAGKPDTISPENRTYDSRETGLMMSEKPYPNNYNINKLKESQTKGASGELPAPYGKYQNVFLSESEYAELKQEYPDSLERLIEEMSRYIASSGNDYANHAATLYRWADREKKENPKKGIPDYSFKEGESL